MSIITVYVDEYSLLFRVEINTEIEHIEYLITKTLNLLGVSRRSTSSRIHLTIKGKSGGSTE